MRFLHTMIRVGDLERSIQFYTEVLGMKLLSKNDYPDGQFTLAFVGYGEDRSQPCVELTYNYGTTAYDLGDGFGHLAFGVEDIYQVCEQIKAKGGRVVREPGPMKHGETILAFIEDPDGYKIELIQSKTHS